MCRPVTSRSATAKPHEVRLGVRAASCAAERSEGWLFGVSDASLGSLVKVVDRLESLTLTADKTDDPR